MRLSPIAVAAAATSCLLAAATPSTSSQRLDSTRLVDSIISRKQGIQDSGAASSTLESGVLAQAIQAVIAQYPDKKDKYARYLSQVLDVASSTGLTNASYAATRPLDRFSLATAIQSAIGSKVAPISDRSVEAYHAINASLALQRRNPDGGLWYFVYPEWSYLDGMFSLLPYMAAQQSVNQEDIVLQITLLRDHCTQTNTSFLVHGYDWSRKAVWADKTTGASPYVWGRSLGWFLAGLVQAWDQLSCKSVQRGPLVELCSTTRNIAGQISAELVKYADPETGAWWQLVTFPGSQGNYLESSSTALFTFSMLKALRIGLIHGSEPDYKSATLKAYNYMTQKFVTDTGNGTIGFDKTVSVCSLNSTATYEYYTKQPLVPNSLLGESAFVLAALEVERLGKS
ncbi:hypothetical protein QQS21_003565 [Conoideocrella luteorostrata]|uniref:Uncharacterized protein n=1 Tax=Conoideocrella luteorostrata TaxID=1105319 RepID=A0AAJ0FVH2_9HYPO|nr:hypothetical protein QQS21_003565 [Conoideocrella luteorostrata]